MGVTQIQTSLATPLIWKALDTWSASFGYIWTNPIEWNPSKKILIYNKTSWRLIPYFFSVFFCFLSLVCHLFFLLAGLFRVIELSITTIIITLFFLLLVIFGFVVELCFLAYGDDWVTAFNGLKNLEKYLQPTVQPKKKNAWKNINQQISSEKRKLKSILTKVIRQNTAKIKNLDTLGLILNVIARLFGFYPYFLVLFGVTIFKLDVFAEFQNYQLLPEIISGNLVINGLYFVLRIPLILIIIIQVCRMMSFFAINQTIASYLILGIISNLDRLTADCIVVHSKRVLYKDQLSLIFSKYDELASLFKIGHNYMSTACFSSMSAVFVIDVVCNFVTLKLYHVLPMPFYLFFPSVSIIIPILVTILLPILVQIYENANKLTIKWGQTCIHEAASLSEMKYLKRRLRAINVVRVHGGLFGLDLYELSDSTKTTFLYEMVNYTINALLSIPVNSQ